MSRPESTFGHRLPHGRRSTQLLRRSAQGREDRGEPPPSAFVLARDQNATNEHTAVAAACAGKLARGMRRGTPRLATSPPRRGPATAPIPEALAGRPHRYRRWSARAALPRAVRAAAAIVSSGAAVLFFISLFFLPRPWLFLFLSFPQPRLSVCVGPGDGCGVTTGGNVVRRVAAAAVAA